jgi:hypothetical protein
MEQYKTLVRNQSNESIQIRTPSNYVYHNIPIDPGASITLRYDDPKFYMAAYERVTYRKKGKVDLQPRSKWKQPDLPFPSTTFLNSGGAQTEVIQIEANNSLILPRGIPITVHTPPQSYYSEFSYVEIGDPIEKVVPDIARRGLLKLEKKPNFIRKIRDKKGMEKLKKLREAIYIRAGQM